MAKKPIQGKAVKRTIAKSGQIYYFEAGKRIKAAKGATKWVNQNYGKANPKDLTASPRELNAFQIAQKSEQRSKRAKVAAEDRLRFGGRFVSNTLKSVLEALKLIGPKTRDLKKEFPTAKTYGELLKQIRPSVPPVTLPETEYGLPSAKRGRETYENIIDIADRVYGDSKRGLKTEDAFGALKLIVVGEQGEEYKGAEALEAIRKWEVQKINEIMDREKDVAFVSFQHMAQIDPVTNEMIIQLAESEPKKQRSP